MKKVVKILRLIAYYIFLFIFSSIGVNNFPIGAIAMIGAVYGSGGILAPAILLSAISAGIFIGTKSLISLLIFIILFVIPIIFIRPLISIEGRNEKKKVGNYILFASLFAFVFFGFLEGIFAVILTYMLYKIFVNVMAVFKNDDEKEIFSIEENVSLFTFLSVGIIYVTSYFNLPLIYPAILIMGILRLCSNKERIYSKYINIYFYFIYIYVLNCT